MAAHADLWGEIVAPAIRTPVSILREQASLLGAKTKHVIEGEVDTRVSGSTFFHLFNLVAPALDNYSYKLFEISHDVGLYPVHVWDASSEDLRDEQAFLDWLGRKLSSSDTKSIIGNLLAQASS
jgi:hypothetical protein